MKPDAGRILSALFALSGGRRAVAQQLGVTESHISTLVNWKKTEHPDYQRLLDHLAKGDQHEPRQIRSARGALIECLRAA